MNETRIADSNGKAGNGFSDLSANYVGEIVKNVLGKGGKYTAPAFAFEENGGDPLRW